MKKEKKKIEEHIYSLQELNTAFRKEIKMSKSPSLGLSFIS
jgi:hypothetical protein